MGNLLKSIVFAAASLVVTTGSASASLVIESWSEPSALKAGTATSGKNDLVDALGLTSLGGYHGSRISLTKRAKLTYTLLGFDASYENYFVAGTSLFSTEAFAPSNRVTSLAGLGSFSEKASAGVLDFRFLTNSGKNGVINGGQNINAAGPSGARKPDFMASIVGSPGALAGNSLYLLLDDLGAGPDNDYDDMVVRIDVEAIPLPASGLLIGSALLGLGFLRRRTN